jgi:hypothetical protein
MVPKTKMRELVRVNRHDLLILAMREYIFGMSKKYFSALK